MTPKKDSCCPYTHIAARPSEDCGEKQQILVLRLHEAWLSFLKTNLRSRCSRGGKEWTCGGRFETGCRRVGKDQGAYGRIGEGDCG
jgi:hypothetical protein